MKIRDTVAEAVLTNKSDAIVAADAEGVISFWNPGAERIFGYTSVEAIGRSLDIIIPERQRKRHWDGYARVVEGEKSRYGDADVLSVPGIRKDGTSVSLEFAIAPLQGEGRRLAGMVAIMRDVTKRFDEMRTLKKLVAANAKP